MTALSWESWVKRYEEQGFRVFARSWPRMEADIEELRDEPSLVAGLGLDEIVDHYAAIIDELAHQPLVVGHSFGGLVTQILLDRGYGAAGVAIASAAAKGVLRLPFSTLRVVAPVAANPLNLHRATALTPKQFHYAFTNTLSDEESLAAYRRYAVPGPGELLFQAAFANLSPHAATTVGLHNDSRSPLLMIAGERDHLSPPSMVEANVKLYRRSAATTEYMMGCSRRSITSCRGRYAARSRAMPRCSTMQSFNFCCVSCAYPQIRAFHTERRGAGARDQRASIAGAGIRW